MINTLRLQKSGLMARIPLDANSLNMWRLVLRLRQADIYLLLADWCGKISRNFR